MINDLDIVQWAYLLDPCFQLVNTAGKPLTEGYIEVYYHGTRTKYYCAADFDGTLHPFQIPLDSLGSNIVLASPDYAYDVYVYNKFGSLVMSRYNVTPGLGGGGGGIPGSDLPEHWLGTDGEAINIASDAVNVCLPLPVSGSVDYEGEFVDHFDDTTLYLNEGMYIVEAVIQFTQSQWDLHNSLNNLKIDTGDGDSSYYWQEDVSGPESNQNVHERKVTFIRKVSGEEPYPFFISPSVGVQLNDVKIRRLNIVKLSAGGTGGGSQPMYKPGPGIAVDDEGVISVTGMQPVSGMNEYVTNITYNNDVTEIFNEIHNVTGDITNIYNEIQSVTGDIHEYTAGSGIIIEDDVISLDPDYVASGAVTQEQLEGVTAVIENTIEGVSTTIINDVNGDISAVTSVLNDKIDAVSAAVPEAQVNADWNATEGKAEILNKPDLSVYATKDEVETATGDLNDKIDAVSADIPDTEEVEFEELDVDSLVTNDALSSVTSVIENTIEGVSTTIVETIEGATSVIENTIEGVSTTIVNEYTGDIESVTAVLNDKIDAVSAEIPDSEEVEFEELDVEALVTNDELQSATSVIENTIEGVSTVLDERIDAVSAAAVVQSDWTEDDSEDPAYIKNKPTEYDLVAGDNISIELEGNDIIISASSPDLSPYATNDELEAVTSQIESEIQSVSSAMPIIEAGSGIVLSVSGDALVISATGAPTTALGKFTIKNNGEGGPIEVICPTDQGFPIETVILDNTAVSGTSGSGTSSVFIVYKSPGYDDDYYSTEGAAILHIPEAVTGIYSIQLMYASNSNPLSSAPPFTNPQYIYGDSTGGRYVLDAGDYDVNAITNVTPPEAGYGKYITLRADGPAPDVQALLKSSFSLAVRHPELGITVNLDRYYLGNTDITTNTSGLTQARIYTDPVTKKQSVYLPSSMPYNWNSGIIQTFQYGSNYNSPSSSSYDTKQYRAYKYTSSPRRYQFAYCTDWDAANSIMTFISYDESGQAIEKWTLNYSNYSSNVWTTTSITPDMSEYIPYSASGVVLPNSKFEIDTEGQAYKIVGESTETNYGSWNGDGSFAYGNGYTLPTRNADGTCTLKAGTYRFTLPETANSIKVSVAGNTAAAYNGMVIPATNHVADLIITEDLTFIPYSQGYDWITIDGFVNSDGTGGYAYPGCWSNNTSVVYISPEVKEEYLTDGDLELNGDNQVIAIDGHELAGDVTMADLVAVSGDLEADIQTVSAAIPDVSNLATKDELESASGTLDAKIDAVSADIPDSEEVEFEELDVDALATKDELESASGTLDAKIEAVSASIPEAQVQSDWTETATGDPAYIKNKPAEYDLVAGQNIEITNSGNDIIIGAVVPPVTGFATEEDLQTVSAAIPDVSDLATKNELQTVSSAVDAVSASIPELPSEEEVEFEELDLSDFASIASVTAVEADVQTVSAAIPDISNLATKTELQTASGSLDAKIDAVSGAIPSAQVQSDWTETASGDPAYIKNKPASTTLVAGSGITIVESGTDLIISSQGGGGTGDVTEQELATVSANLEADIQTVSAALPEYPEVTPLIAGDGITIAASGEAFVISSDDSASAVNVEAGTGIDIAPSGNSLIFSWMNTAGITDIQYVNALPASPDSHVLYIIPET